MTELKNAEHFKEREIYALVLQNSEYIIILKRSEEQQQKKPLSEKQWVSNMIRKLVLFPQPKDLLLENHLWTYKHAVPLLHHLNTATIRFLSAVEQYCSLYCCRTSSKWDITERKSEDDSTSSIKTVHLWIYYGVSGVRIQCLFFQFSCICSSVMLSWLLIFLFPLSVTDLCDSTWPEKSL